MASDKDKKRKRSSADSSRSRKKVKKEPRWHGDSIIDSRKDVLNGDDWTAIRRSTVKKEKIKREKDRRVKQEKTRVKKEKKPQNRVYPESHRRAQALRNKKDSDSDSEEEEVEKPNFVPSGALKKGTHLQKNGKDLKYLPPPEATKPNAKWRMYVFKDGDEKRVLHLHRKDHFLFGRDRKVCDIDLHHISISQQHAALQYRLRRKTTMEGETYSKIVPYIIDLDSSHGTKINNEKIIPRKYYELLSKDVINFGLSSRNYVFLMQDEVKIDYDEATVTNYAKKSKVKLKEVEPEKKDFVEIGENKPKAVKEMDEDELWDL